MRPIRYLIVHNNGVAGRTIADITRTHKARGYLTVGYHTVIHEDGSAHKGRPDIMPGAHVLKRNWDTKGYCVVGNGDAQDFNPAQYETLTHLLADDCQKYGVPVSRIRGHRETHDLVPGTKFDTTKTCPGQRVDMDLLRARVFRELQERFDGAPRS